MEISLNASYHSYILKIEDGNYKLELDIEKRAYPIDISGKIDTKKPVERDIDEQYILKLSRVLEDMIYYRKKEFDSSTLIEILFTKLLSNIASDLVDKLYQDYKI